MNCVSLLTFISRTASISILPSARTLITRAARLAETELSRVVSPAPVKLFLLSIAIFASVMGILLKRELNPNSDVIPPFKLESLLFVVSTVCDALDSSIT